MVFIDITGQLLCTGDIQPLAQEAQWCPNVSYSAQRQIIFYHWDQGLLRNIIHIFPFLLMDTIIVHIYGLIRACHGGRYGPYSRKYGQYWCPCEEQEKCGVHVKAELKTMHLFKVMAKTKYVMKM